MSRTNQRDTEIRRTLETIAAEVAFIKRVAPITQMRVQQGMDQTGLNRLFRPALCELDDVSKSVDVISKQVSLALSTLLKE